MSAMTIDELLAEIAAANRNDAGHTTEEWAEQMGCGPQTARIKIKRLMKAGKMAHGMAQRTTMRGRVITTDVYRIL